MVRCSESETADVYRRAFNSAHPLCLTEIGFLSGEGYPPLPADWFWAGGTTAADQAAWLGESLRSKLLISPI